MGWWEAAEVASLLGRAPELWSGQPPGLRAPSEALRSESASWPNYYYPVFIINGRQCLMFFAWERLS